MLSDYAKLSIRRCDGAVERGEQLHKPNSSRGGFSMPYARLDAADNETARKHHSIADGAHFDRIAER